MRREILALMIVSAAVIALISVMMKPGGGGFTVKIGYNQYSINHAPAMLAFDREYFPDRAEEVKFSSGKDVAMSLAAGDIDVGYGGISNFFQPTFSKLASGNRINGISNGDLLTLFEGTRESREVEPVAVLQGSDSYEFPELGELEDYV